MPPRILVVEDDPSILRGIELNLQLEGFETLAATDGGAALDARRRRRGPRDPRPDDPARARLPGLPEAARARRQRCRSSCCRPASPRSDIVMGSTTAPTTTSRSRSGSRSSIARVKAHLRRHAPADRRSTRFGDVEIDLEQAPRPPRRRASSSSPRGSTICSRSSWRTRAARSPATRSSQAVWGAGVPAGPIARSTTSSRGSARSSIYPASRAHFLTVRGVGYRFVAER